MNTLIKKNWSGLFSDIFEDVVNGVETISYGYPKVNTVETENDYRVDVYYPGMKKEDFKVKVESRTLSINLSLSEEKKEDTDKYHFREFAKREFSRRFILPEEVVKKDIKASYEDGVLKIVIPKDKEKEKQSNFNINVE